VALAVAFAWMALRIPDRHEPGTAPFLESLVPKMDDQGESIRSTRPTSICCVFTHFLALALVVARFFPRKGGHTQLEMAASDGAVRPAFASAFFASAYSCPFGAHWILVQHAQGGGAARLWMQLLVSVGGILIMIGLAWLPGSGRKGPPTCSSK